MTQMTAELNTPVSVGEGDIRQYLYEIRNVPMLTQQQEIELAKRCAEGDQDAVKELVKANLRLVVSVAKEYSGRGVPLMDLIQEGSIGLLTAAKKFDYTMEYRFSTYATKWIRQGVTRYLTEHGSVIRVGVDGINHQVQKSFGLCLKLHLFSHLYSLLLALYCSKC